MLTGTPTFQGETVTDLLAAVVMDDPDWTHLPAETPARVRRLLFRCLAKDPKRRFQDIGDARVEIESIDEVIPGLSEAGRAVAARSRSRWLPWLAGASLALGVVVRATSPYRAGAHRLDRASIVAYCRACHGVQPRGRSTRTPWR